MGDRLTTPDLQRIRETLKACREDLVLVPIGGESYEVGSMREGRSLSAGTRSECLAYIDTRCAEATVRAMRIPSAQMVDVGERHVSFASDHVSNAAAAAAAFTAMCDAILGETQP